MGLMDGYDYDIDLSATKKKRFRINGDNDKILELNTSDMGIVARLEEAYPKLEDKMKEISQMDDSTRGYSSKLRAADEEMSDMIDYIFAANVSELCKDGGTMYDPYNGTYRFEHIISTFIQQYENNLQAEYKKIQERLRKHTGKYTGK